MSQFHSLAWQEYLDSLYAEKQEINQATGINPIDSFSAVLLDPNYQEAKRLADVYIENEGYLSNVEGLRDFLKANLEIKPPYQINNVDCIEAMFFVLINSRDYCLPYYSAVYDIETSDPLPFESIIENSEPLEVLNKFPEELNFGHRQAEMREMWGTRLREETKEEILGIEDSSQQIKRLIEISNIISTYKAEEAKILALFPRDISTWLQACIAEYKRMAELLEAQDNSIYAELDRLEDLESPPFFDRNKFLLAYVTLAKRYLSEVKFPKGHEKYKRHKSLEWETFFENFIKNILINNPELIKQTLFLTRDFDQAEYRFQEKKILDLLENISLK